MNTINVFYAFFQCLGALLGALSHHRNLFCLPGKRGFLVVLPASLWYNQLDKSVFAGELIMDFLDTDFLESNEIKLLLERKAEADPVRNWVPAYHFMICDKQGNGMGQCDLRIGYNDGLYYGGHIGYSINEEYRGHHYAAKACMLLFELAKRHGMDHLYITCDPDNWPSRKTLEYLKGELLEIAELPEDNDMRVNDGDTEKCIFRFDL